MSNPYYPDDCPSPDFDSEPAKPRSLERYSSPSLALIQEYLELGGLFNPELMEHDRVRDMAIQAFDEIKRLRSELANK